MSDIKMYSLSNICGPRPSESKFTQDVVIKIGNQVKNLLSDSALDFTGHDITLIVNKILDLGVTNSRGVELITQSYFATGLSDIESIGKLVESVLWELTLTNDFTDGLVAVKETTDVLVKLIGNVPLSSVDRAVVMRALAQYSPPKDGSGVETTTSPVPAVVTPKTVMRELEENFYRSMRRDDELVMSREYGVHPTSGMALQGKWVLRNYHTGEFMDSDKYMIDLAERNNIKIK